MDKFSIDIIIKELPFQVKREYKFQCTEKKLSAWGLPQVTQSWESGHFHIRRVWVAGCTFGNSLILASLAEYMLYNIMAPSPHKI